ncbi:hypothetical protein LCAZH_2352 [Lacticaseibacillus paracasei]|nr:hypothetical protein LCAZH_2352 [Lacticaseibacillus paracasei]
MWEYQSFFEVADKVMAFLQLVIKRPTKSDFESDFVSLLSFQ